MNKEVIYLEPDEDITDILTKLQQAEQKLVALVPPKKATMLRSAVNMKLVARAAKECKKVIVIVTADPALLKLAMAAQIPVAKTLQSRPIIPTKDSIAASENNDTVISEDDDSEALSSLKDKKSAKNAKTAASAASASATGSTIDLSDEDLEKDSKNNSKNSKNAQKGRQQAEKGPSDKKALLDSRLKKWLPIGAVAAVLVAIFLVWALVFAPSVKITVAMSTSADNFSEEIRFTTDKNAENLSEGVLFAEKRNFEQEYNEKATATGKEDRGEKAKGSVMVSYTFKGYSYPNGFNKSIAKGTSFTASNGKGYTSTTDASLKWDGNFPLVCDNNKKISNGASECTMSVTIPVVAEDSGENYDYPAGGKWNSVCGAVVTNPSAISGGTTNDVTVITQADIDKTKDGLVSNHALEGKETLISEVKNEDTIIIESSFSSEVTDVKSTPAAGGVVENREKEAEVEVKVTYSVYTLQKSQIEAYIKAKTALGEDRRIYSIGEPYVERFTSIEEPARLKTVIKTGPTVTEENIVEKAKGRKIGEVQSLLRSINGVSSVNITPSFFWVRTIPNDNSKITVELTVEDN